VIGIDTNVLIRFLTADDALQYQKSVELFETEIIFIGNTVFLETEWVLRHSYGYDCLQISDAFRKVIGLENVEVMDAYYLEVVIAAHVAGLDFADALHWIGNRHCSAFLSFDRRFIQRANLLSQQLNIPIVREVA
jgi:predicted nucleic-acid-binding protein